MEYEHYFPRYILGTRPLTVAVAWSGDLTLQQQAALMHESAARENDAYPGRLSPEVERELDAGMPSAGVAARAYTVGRLAARIAKELGYSQSDSQQILITAARRESAAALQRSPHLNSPTREDMIVDLAAFFIDAVGEGQHLRDAHPSDVMRMVTRQTNRFSHDVILGLRRALRNSPTNERTPAFAA